MGLTVESIAVWYRGIYRQGGCHKSLVGLPTKLFKIFGLAYRISKNFDKMRYLLKNLKKTTFLEARSWL